MFFLDFAWFFLYDECPVSVSWSHIKRDWVCPNQSRVFIREYVFVILYSLERADCSLQLCFARENEPCLLARMGDVTYLRLIFTSVSPLTEV